MQKDESFVLMSGVSMFREWLGGEVLRVAFSCFLGTDVAVVVFCEREKVGSLLLTG